MLLIAATAALLPSAAGAFLEGVRVSMPMQTSAASTLRMELADWDAAAKVCPC